MTLQKITCSDEGLANYLELTRWAKDFSWDEICHISEHMSAYSASKGTVIFDEGAKDSTLCIVIRGKVDIIKRQSGSRANVIASILPSQSFGEMSLLDGEPRSAQAVAATDVELLLLTRKDLFKLREQHPRLAFDLLWLVSRMLSQRLRRTSGNLVAQLNKPAK